MDDASGFVVKMGVLDEVRAVSGGFAGDVYLLNGTVLDEGFEAVIDSSERHAAFLALHALENFAGGGMIPVFHQSTINLFALFGHAQSRDFQFMVRDGHRHGKLAGLTEFASLNLELF